MIDRCFRGQCWVFGDNINNDVAFMFSEKNKFLTNPKELAKYCMVGYDPGFPGKAKSGDIIVAGKNFGWGHAHDQFHRSMKGLGINLVLAESFGRDFFRVAITLGYPVPYRCGKTIKGKIKDGDKIAVDLVKGQVTNSRTDETIAIKPFPQILLPRLDAGGSMGYLKTLFQDNR